MRPRGTVSTVLWLKTRAMEASLEPGAATLPAWPCLPGWQHRRGMPSGCPASLLCGLKAPVLEPCREHPAAPGRGRFFLSGAWHRAAELGAAAWHSEWLEHKWDGYTSPTCP